MQPNIKNQTYDAVIIGVRCAGAATGMLLARAGARVLIVDREAQIGYTLSTHALMRPAVSLLGRVFRHRHNFVAVVEFRLRHTRGVCGNLAH